MGKHAPIDIDDPDPWMKPSRNPLSRAKMPEAAGGVETGNEHSHEGLAPFASPLASMFKRWRRSLGKRLGGGW